MRLYKDQLGQEIRLDRTPERIISLVPSQSEFLWDLDLGEKLVGITKFCIHPDKMFRTIERVGGTKKLDIGKIRKLKPDLIIGNREENERADIEELKKEFPVWMSDIYTLEDAYNMMKEIGDIVEKNEKAESIINQIVSSMQPVRHIFNSQHAAYFIWKDPFMVAGRNTFIDHLLQYIGLTNVFGGLARYPEVSVEDIKALRPEFIFLSSEPFPFREKHCSELQRELPDCKVMVVDGEMFSWYGSRLLKTAEYFKGLKGRLLDKT